MGAETTSNATASGGGGGDVALVLRARRGDRAAFEQLVRNVGRLLYTHLLLKTRDPETAADLTQETLLIAWKRLRELHDPAKFRAWLLTIGSTVAIDSARYLGRRKRSAAHEIPEEFNEVSDPQPTPYEQAERTEQRARVLSALNELPEEYRLALSLRYLAGADYDAIGRQLALTNGSLRGLLHRGMKLLRRRVEELGLRAED